MLVKIKWQMMRENPFILPANKWMMQGLKKLVHDSDLKCVNASGGGCGYRKAIPNCSF